MPRYESSSSVVRVASGVAAPVIDWELLYDVHSVRLRRIIQRKVGSALVEDVLQETFLRAFKSRHTIDPTRPIAPWLITIALRTAADAHRNQLRSVESVAIEDDQSPDLALDSLEQELLNRARRLGIKHAFASLNTRQRRLLELVAVDGMTYDSVADREDMTPDAVKSALARARSNFRTTFTAATGESGPFAVGVGGWLLRRLRPKGRRTAFFLGQHAAGFGAATVSAALVAAVVAPVVRPFPTQAKDEVRAEFAGSLGRAPAQHVPVPMVGFPSPENHQASAVPAPAASTASTVRVESSVSLQRHGSTLEGTTAGSAGTASVEVWGYSITEVQCDAGSAGTTLCDLATGTPPPPLKP